MESSALCATGAGETTMATVATMGNEAVSLRIKKPLESIVES